MGDLLVRGRESGDRGRGGLGGGGEAWHHESGNLRGDIDQAGDL